MAAFLARTRALIAKAIAPANAAPITSRNSWYPIIREPYTGAWQNNDEIKGETALSYWAVFSCVTLITGDIGKMRLRLVSLDDDGVWTETTNPAYSPVIRKPNRYQTFQKFAEQWISSKLIHGNAYVLKERDNRGVVRALYVLDPRRVVPLVAPDGAVYYQINKHDHDLTGLNPADGQDRGGAIVVPASEMIHDPMVCLFHPLIGVTPLYAAGFAAAQGLTIQSNSAKFFANGSNPCGVLTAPGEIGDDTAKRLQEYWQTNYAGAQNVGKVAVMGDGLKYEPFTVNAADAQLIEQLRWTAETICACYHVPFFMVDSSKAQQPDKPESLVQQYYSQCLQSLSTAFEWALDEGLELAPDLGTEFDVDDLVWMDTATKTKAAADTIGSGALSPNEARLKYFGLGKVKGGDSPMVQQQYYSLAALAERDANKPFAKPTPATPPGSPDTQPDDDDNDDDNDAAEPTDDGDPEAEK